MSDEQSIIDELEDRMRLAHFEERALRFAVQEKEAGLKLARELNTRLMKQLEIAMEALEFYAKSETKSMFNVAIQALGTIKELEKGAHHERRLKVPHSVFSVQMH